MKNRPLFVSILFTGIALPLLAQAASDDSKTPKEPPAALLLPDPDLPPAEKALVLISRARVLIAEDYLNEAFEKLYTAATLPNLPEEFEEQAFNAMGVLFSHDSRDLKFSIPGSPSGKKAYALCARAFVPHDSASGINPVDDMNTVLALPDVPPMCRTYAFLCLSQCNRGETAVEYLSKAAAVPGISPNTRARMLLYQAKQIRNTANSRVKMIPVYTELLASPEIHNSFRIEALSKRAGAYEDLGKYTEALADWTLLLSLSGDSPQAWYLPKRAEIYEKTGELQKALDDYILFLQLTEKPEDNWKIKGAKEAIERIKGLLQKQKEEKQVVIEALPVPPGIPARTRPVQRPRRGGNENVSPDISELSAKIADPATDTNTRAISLIQRATYYEKSGDFQKEFSDYSALLKLPGISDGQQLSVLLRRETARFLKKNENSNEALKFYDSILAQKDILPTDRVVALALKADALAELRGQRTRQEQQARQATFEGNAPGAVPPAGRRQARTLPRPQASENPALAIYQELSELKDIPASIKRFLKISPSGGIYSSGQNIQWKKREIDNLRRILINASRRPDHDTDELTKIIRSSSSSPEQRAVAIFERANRLITGQRSLPFLGRRNAKADFYYLAAIPGVSEKLKSGALKKAAELEQQDKDEIASFADPLWLEKIEYEILKIKYPEKQESELRATSLSRRGNRSRPPENNLRVKSLERFSETIASPEASSAEKIQALQNRARMRSGDCDFDGAIEDYIAYYSIPGNEGAGIQRQEMWGLPVTLRLQGNPPKSIAILKKLLSNPALKVEFQNEFRLALALTYDEYGELAEALALCNEVLKSGEKRVKFETLLRRAEIYTELAENEKAIADLSAALKESSNRHQISEIYTRRAKTYKQAGEIKKAIADCTGSINLDSALRDKNEGSNFSTARFLRAELEEEIGELDKALEDYAYVLENLSKTDGKRKATALWLRGRLYGMANQREKELSDILKVFYGDEPRNGFDSFVTNLKEFSKFREAYHRNDVVAKKAIADYTKLLASNQSEANRSVFLYLRGLAWRKLGETAKAEADFRLAEGLTEVPFLLEKELERVRSKH